jgi:hypothetical protein
MAKTKKVDAEDTKEKICEAKYFLDRMIESQNDPKHFKYNLSAFLASFRSIWHFMNMELTGTKLQPCNQKLHEWRRNALELQLLSKSRDTTIHRRIIATRNDVAVHVTTVSAEAQALPVSVRIENANGSVVESLNSKEEYTPASEETAQKDKPWAEYTWYFALDDDTKDIPNVDSILQKDVITICQTCFKELVRRISACDEGLLKPIC